MYSAGLLDAGFVGAGAGGLAELVAGSFGVVALGHAAREAVVFSDGAVVDETTGSGMVVVEALVESMLEVLGVLAACVLGAADVAVAMGATRLEGSLAEGIVSTIVTLPSMAPTAMMASERGVLSCAAIDGARRFGS